MDDTAARSIIERTFENYDCSVTQFGSIEPMMGGFLAGIECDDMSDALGNDATGVRINQTEIREGRRWHTILGRTRTDGWNVAFHGEWGTYGALSEAPDILRFQVWVGQVDVPGDVDYSFTLDHDVQIAQSAITSMHVAAEALRHVSDEALARTPSETVVPGILEQMKRLQTAN